jgi:hypothetical protein
MLDAFAGHQMIGLLGQEREAAIDKDPGLDCVPAPGREQPRIILEPEFEGYLPDGMELVGRQRYPLVALTDVGQDHLDQGGLRESHPIPVGQGARDGGGRRDRGTADKDRQDGSDCPREESACVHPSQMPRRAPVDK